MGTRNLFTITYNDKTVLAKYYQWDGYLENQGKALSNFIVNDLDFELLKSKLDLVKMENGESAKIAEIYDEMNNLPWENDSRIKNFPLITRDGTILDALKAIQNASNTLYSVDASDFADDGLFCEYAYKLNLDTNIISVFKSGQKRCDKLIFKCDILEYPEILEKFITKAAKNA